MWNVSSEYLKAVSKPNREFKIFIRFYYKDGTQAEFNDSSIIGDSDVEIASQAISGSASCDKIDIGAAIAAKASMSIIDNDVNLHRYTGSSFEAYVYLKLENGEFEEVPMGRFYTDTSQLSRQKNKINIVGYDAMLSLMYVLTDEHRRQLKGSTAKKAAQFLAAYSNCGFEQDLSEFPNNGIPLDFGSPQVETARDGIMWIAQLLGCFAHINRLGYLEFVPIKSTWKYFNEEHTVGTIIAVRNIQGSERYKTTFSDDRIHIVGLSMPDRDNNLITRSVGGLKDDANITVALNRNPLVIDSSTPLEDILNAILNQVRTTYFYAFKTEIISDPALDAGDTIRLQGGVINGTNKNNDLIGFITHNVWRYRGHHEITNAGQVPIVYAEGETATVALSSDTAALADSDNELFYLPPKSQEEKARSGMGGIPDRITAIRRTVLWGISTVLAGHEYVHLSNPMGISSIEGLSVYYGKEKKPSFSIGRDTNDRLSLLAYRWVSADSDNEFAIPALCTGLSIAHGTLKYRSYNRFSGEFIEVDLLNGITQEYVSNAISAHDTDESAHEHIQGKISNVQDDVDTVTASVTQLRGSLTTTNTNVQTNTENITQLREDLNEVQSEYAHTTKIAFKEDGFDLTFADKDGEETVNEFTIEETNGKITKITNTTAGREIEITYE